MKKLVLILVSSFILIIFIAFNYLLWDRDKSLKGLGIIDNSADSLSDVRSRVEKLENDKNKLETQVGELKNKNKTLEEGNIALQKQNSEFIYELTQKNNIIFEFKKKVSLKEQETVISNWIKYINSKQYEDVLNIQYGQLKINGELIDSVSFVNSLKANIKTMYIRSINAEMDGANIETIGEIVFKGVLEVNTSGMSTSVFKNGANNVSVFVTYDREKASWVISGLTVSR